MLQILDTLVIILFVLFMIYIFRGYHLTRLDRDRTQPPVPSSTDKTSDVSSVSDREQD